ncbi:MAG TPA: hypothetical protein GX708_15485 [Gallicola sp.]|nr:hypothetical protein [Gallicola sp.]
MYNNKFWYDRYEQGTFSSNFNKSFNSYLIIDWWIEYFLINNEINITMNPEQIVIFLKENIPEVTKKQLKWVFKERWLKKIDDDIVKTSLTQFSNAKNIIFDDLPDVLVEVLTEFSSD